MMPSGSKRHEYSDEQYRKQLAHSRAWKKRNKDRVKQYNREYNRRKRRERKADLSDAFTEALDGGMLDSPE